MTGRSPSEEARVVNRPCTEPTTGAAPASRQRALGRGRWAALLVAVLSLGLQACGGSAPLEVDAARAVAPQVPAAEADPAGAARERSPRPERREEPAVEAPAAEPAPVAPRETAPRPGAVPAPPDLVVGDDGCVTDRTTGLVVTCHDDAAGPDDPTS